MTTTTEPTRPRQVDIKEITVINAIMTPINVLPMLVELNLFEDMFAGGMYGNITLNDDSALIDTFSFMGEELINLHFDTPKFDTPIRKTFRCCGITNRFFVRDSQVEQYTIHFVSPEVAMDHFGVIQTAFDGKVDDIVEKIYTDYLLFPRYYEVNEDNTSATPSEEETPLRMISEYPQKIKFVSPSWSPIKCLSWLASKIASVPPITAPNALFFESNKSYNFGSIEEILVQTRKNQALAGVYYYVPGNLRDFKSDSGSPIGNTVNVGGREFSSPDIPMEFFGVHDLTVITDVDSLKNMQKGYLASVYHKIDVMNKQHTVEEYDHVENFYRYNHTSPYATGFFLDGAVRSPYAHQFVGFSHPGLHTGVENNLNETASKIMPARNSLLQDIGQIKLKLDAAGRTDIEVGNVIYMYYPRGGVKSDIQTTLPIRDEHYSGVYIITAIHHRINREEHLMTMEVVKDSFDNGANATGGLDQK